MKRALREIVKDELQKLLNVGFIYPISDSQWVSPLDIISKNNGKWRVCVDYRELNKATLIRSLSLVFYRSSVGHFSKEKYFSFLDGFSGYNQIRIAPKDQEMTTFTCPWGIGLCNIRATFQRAVLGIF